MRENPTKSQEDVFRPFLDSFWAAGIAAAATAGNEQSKEMPPIGKSLTRHVPRCHGGAGTPLVVVGNVHYNNSRNPDSQYLELQDPPQDHLGILTLYAVGSRVVCAATGPPGSVNQWARQLDGTSQATAMTSGLMAYFLADPVLHASFVAGGVGNMPMRLKTHLIQVALANKSPLRMAGQRDIPILSSGDNIECDGGRVPPPDFVVPPLPELEVLLPPRALELSRVSEGFKLVWEPGVQLSVRSKATVTASPAEQGTPPIPRYKDS